jgi:2-polyprenyl-3-methyl-5-hydroxy-6-metoxy-1,4-benzoquinol methylase
MEQVILMEKCPVCENEFYPAGYFSFKDYKVFTCAGCHVRFARPFADNSKIYTADYIQKREVYLAETNLNFSDILPLQPYINVAHKKILDIGCGMGSFLEKLKENNEVLGLEVSQDFRPFLAQKSIPCIIGELEDNVSSLPDSYYDLITFWDVFEHLYEPLKVLSLIKGKLSPHGIIINWTNNYDDSISFIAELSYRLSFGLVKILMEHSFNRFSGHNYNFVSRTLDFIYKKAGLKVLDTIITDTPSERLTNNVAMKMSLDMFYMCNKLLGKGKIICHILGA